MHNTTSLSRDLSMYYEKKFFLSGYGGDQIRANYEWDYYHSKQYVAFIKRAQALSSGSSYRDKRTRAFRYYLANEKTVRKAYEQIYPVPKPIDRKKSKRITFTRYSSIKEQHA